MDIIISGLGAVGTTLMQELADEGHNVVVVDINGDKIEKAVNQFDVKGVIGNSASADVLKEANVAYAELFIGATNHDELNILCCIIAKRLGAKKTIARVSKPEYLELFGNENNLGISLLVNPQYEAALEISRMLRFPSAIKVNEFSNGKVELVEFRVDETKRPRRTRTQKFELEIQGKSPYLCGKTRRKSNYPRRRFRHSRGG